MWFVTPAIKKVNNQHILALYRRLRRALYYRIPSVLDRRTKQQQLFYIFSQPIYDLNQYKSLITTGVYQLERLVRHDSPETLFIPPNIMIRRPLENFFGYSRTSEVYYHSFSRTEPELFNYFKNSVEKIIPEKSHKGINSHLDKIKYLIQTSFETQFPPQPIILINTFPDWIDTYGKNLSGTRSFVDKTFDTWEQGLGDLIQTKVTP